ncbi:MAG: helix-turn-helix domain-containing protein, partial [Spirochaetaceae bacterium]
AAAMVLLIYTCTMLVLVTPGVPGCTERARLSAPGASADDDCLRLAARVGRELEGGAFRDPELSLQKLAERLNVHPNRLSRAINHVYGESYPALLARCRLDYFIRRVRTGCLDECNILELAFDAGFSSKSSFNRVFKEYFGIAPSVFTAANGACSDAVPGLAIRPGRATMPGNGNRTNRSLQRYSDPPLARDARGNGRSGSR